MKYKFIKIMAILAVLGIALFFRFYQLNQFPAEFHYDEWQEGVDAIAILNGEHRIFSETNKGREPLFTYLVATAFSIWQPQVLLIRVVGALAGFLAVAFTYPMVRELFRQTSLRYQHWLATLATLGMAIGYWQIHHTRIGLRHTLLPLLLTLLVFTLWRGLNTRHWVWFGLTGGFLGLSLYTYPAARFIPILLLLFFAIDFAIRWMSRQPQEALLSQHWRNLVLSASVASIVFAPLGYYFLFERPDLFTERASEVSILNAEQPLDTLRQTVIGNYNGFFFTGDERTKYNLPYKPIFDPLMGVAFLIGVGIAGWQIRQPQYLFVLLWLQTMLLPAMLVADRIPAFKRAIGLAPGLYILPALTFVMLWHIHGSKRKQATSVALYVCIGLLAVVVYGSTTIQTYRDYFFEWGPSHPHYEWVVMYDNLTEQMRLDNGNDTVWIFPQDPRNRVPRYRQITGFWQYPDLPPSEFIPIDESGMFNRLTDITRVYSQVVLVDVQLGQEADADHKQIVALSLEKYGHLDEVHTGINYELSRYTLDTAFEPVQHWQPHYLDFGGELRLVEAAFGDASGVHPPDTARVPAGESAWLVLRWQAIQHPAENYKASVRLVDREGYIYSQVDTLLTNAYQTPSHGWRPDEVAYSYHLLPTPPQTPPDAYQLELVVYSEASSQPVTAQADTSGPTTQPRLGQLELTPALSPPPIYPVEQVRQRWAAGLQLVDHSPLPTSDLRPGDRIDVSLLWQATADRPAASAFSLNLMDGLAAEVAYLGEYSIGGGQFPIGQWRGGELIEQRLPLHLPPDLAAESYQINLTVGAETEAVTLGTVRVQGQMRTFALPPEVQNRLDVVFGSQMMLAGYEATLDETQQLQLTLYWQATDVIGANYKIFVHILDSTGRIITQRDQIPAAGARPTTSWLPNEIIRDAYRLPLTTEVTHLAIGLYNEADGQRLTLPESTDNRLLIPLTSE